MNLAPGSIYS
jgi:hypothetical protein